MKTMSENYHLHIIAHTHWDREWYMPFEKHRIRLVHFMDTLIETMEKNEDFRFFHLDGQMILIEDYLDIRPEMEARLKALIQAGRIFIGPWYVLQDEYLTSGEANIRNLKIGMKMAEEYGEPLNIGYFPDAFGNISQAPQILNGFGIERAVFGRGLSNLGPDNTVAENAIADSELIWASPDGSDVTSVMFANWYHNAMELPTEKEALTKRLKSIVRDTKRFATTNELLGMNGCDHLPLQTNLPEVIKNAQGLLDDVTVSFSHFDGYFEALEDQQPDLRKHTGEIAGQYTNGWYLLVSTASSRIHTKQLNVRAQNELTIKTEPLLAFFNLHRRLDYQALLEHGWKTLMENHPHDTICGCSNDRTHEDMITMLKRSIDISEGLREDALRRMVDRKNQRIHVLNSGVKPIRQIVDMHVDLPLEDDVPEDGFQIENDQGDVLPCEVRDLGKTFTYQLPEDAFRNVVYTHRFHVRFLSDIQEGFGLSAYKIMPRKQKKVEPSFVFENNTLKSATVELSVLEDGSITIYDKYHDTVYKALNTYEDKGDRGDEYEFVETTDQKTVLSDTTKASIELADVNALQASIRLRQILDIPEGIDEETRSEATKPLSIETTYTIYHHTNRIDVRVQIENDHENHRLRVLFPTFKNDNVRVLAEGQFDLNERPVVPWEGWENPSHLQRFETMVMAENKTKALMIATRGLHEYEVLPDKQHTLAITLLRSVGRLGDWGEFPTPDAQMKQTHTVEYAILPYQTTKRGETLQEGYVFSQKPLQGIQAEFDELDPDKTSNLIFTSHPDVYTSAVKTGDDGTSLIVRLYHLGERESGVLIDIAPWFKNVDRVNLNEDHMETMPIENGTIHWRANSKEIITLALMTSKTERN